MADIIIQPKNLEIDVEQLFGNKIQEMILKMMSEMQVPESMLGNPTKKPDDAI